MQLQDEWVGGVRKSHDYHMTASIELLVLSEQQHNHVNEGEHLQLYTLLFMRTYVCTKEVYVCSKDYTLDLLPTLWKY